MLIRKGTFQDVETIQKQLVSLRRVRAELRRVGARNAAQYVARAIKSVEGAERHALRCARNPPFSL